MKVRVTSFRKRTSVMMMTTFCSRNPVLILALVLSVGLTACDGISKIEETGGSEPSVEDTEMNRTTASVTRSAGSSLSDAEVGPQECVSSAAFVVQTLPELRDATVSATPGDTIAIDGMITVRNREVTLKSVPNVTLTCASLGSGLKAAPSFESGTLLAPFRKNLTISNLVLDSESSQNLIPHVIFSIDNERNPRAVAENLQILNNRFRCSDLSCVAMPGVDEATVVGNEMDASSTPFAIGSFRSPENNPPEGLTVKNNSIQAGGNIGINLRGATGTIANNEVRTSGTASALRAAAPSQRSGLTIHQNTFSCETGGVCAITFGYSEVTATKNRIEAEALLSGLHLQAASQRKSIDGSYVAQNVVTTERSVDSKFFGGIRVRDGRNVTVEENTVLGPWSNGIAFTQIIDGLVKKNKIEGPVDAGINLSLNALGTTPELARNNQFRNNRVSDPGEVGMLARKACDNGFVGNQVPSKAEKIPGVIFTETTGDNTWVGNGSSGIDRGNLDCDGDGQVDPNQVTGLSPIRGGIDVADITPQSSSSLSIRVADTTMSVR